MNELVKEALSALIAIFSPVLGMLLILLVSKLLSYMGQKNLAEQVRNNQQLAINAAAFAENLAAKSLKNSNLVLPGTTKLSKATEYMLTRNPKITEQEAHEWVETVLPQIGKGALQNLTQSVQELQK